MNEPENTPEVRSLHVTRGGHDIFHGKEAALFTLLKKAANSKDREKSGTKAGTTGGVREHLMDKFAARDLRDFNPTHAISIEAKVTSTVGLGHRDQDIHDKLNPLCEFSWQDTLDALAEDYWETGECFLEVVRGEEDKTVVTGLHHIESARVYIEIEQQDNPNEFHYLVEGDSQASTIIMARFGDLESLKERQSNPDGPGGEEQASTYARSHISGNIVDSEIIHIRQATNRSRWHGYPDYMSAVPSIELVQCMTQAEFDFYYNRGVPEFMAFLIGTSLTTEDWTKFENMVKGSQGIGNSHKTAAVQLPGDGTKMKVQIEKLAMEDGSNRGFTENSGTLASNIATAHGVPLMLANIAIAGKMGGSNEGPNALLLFQKRKLGKAQRNFSTMFACTLAGKDTKLLAEDATGHVKITADQFLGTAFKQFDEESEMQLHISKGNGFNTILDGMNLGAMDTMDRMREPIAGSDRDLNEGINTSAQDRKPGDSRGEGQRGGPRIKAS